MDNLVVPPSLIPANDEDRLKKLYQYAILNTAPEEAFDKITRLAAQIFEVPDAFISFVDREMVFNKSSLSDVKLLHAHRADSVVAEAILNAGVTHYPDLWEMPGLRNKSSVRKEGGIRSFTGAPLISPEGYYVGMISVADGKPMEFSKHRGKILQTLATVVVDELELRLVTHKNVKVQADLMNIAVHDLKSPLTAIQLYSQMIYRLSGEEKIKTMADKVTISSGQILKRLNELLDLSRIENGDIKIQREYVDVCELLRIVQSNFEILATQKNQSIHLHANVSTPISLDRDRMQEVFENLTSNAIKYAYPGTNIDIDVTQRGRMIVVEFRDEGQGLNETDLSKLFTRYARLSAIPTGKERSSGLGLSIVKTLVELHQGKVWAESKGKGMGASFFVSLPIVDGG